MSRALVQTYVDRGWRIITWPQIGDAKGPREGGWPTKVYTLADYHEGYRVGILTGCEVAPGKFLHDVDIDWAPGSTIAQKLIPNTNFVFGRPSKPVSHCFYTLPEKLPTFKYEDIDGTSLIELRGTKLDGGLGCQTMVPPSVWTKDGLRESLAFFKDKDADPAHLDANRLKHAVCLAAIGMLLAKHFGANGFGHDPRLAWAGFLLHAGIKVDDLVDMGEAISVYTNNLEISDVRTVVESTDARLSDKKQGKFLPKIRPGKSNTRRLEKRT